jgi:hypothetical protein
VWLERCSPLMSSWWNHALFFVMRMGLPQMQQVRMS